MQQLQLRQGVEARSLQLALRCLEALPYSLACRLGEQLGRLAWRVLARRRAIALANLALVWGASRSEGELRQIAQRSFISLGLLLADFAQARRLTAATLPARVEYQGWEEYERLRASGRGVIFLAAHFGSWELLPQAQALRGAPMSFIVRPADNPRVEAVIREYREHHGNRVIEKRNALRECLRRLRGGDTVGILIDQRVPAEQGVVTPFLGQNVYTTTVVAALAERTGAAVVPAFIRRLPGRRQQICLGEVIEPRRDASGRVDIPEMTQRCVAVVERFVSQAPDHWLWIHRRFRHEATTNRLDCSSSPNGPRELSTQRPIS